MPQPIIVVLGSINMDLVATVERIPHAGETVLGSHLAFRPGGKGANQAVAAVRMGAMVRLIGRVGADSFGQQLLQGLSSEGVDVAGVAVDSTTSSGIALILLEPGGENRIVLVGGANQRCGYAEESRATHALDRATALLLQLEVPVEVSLKVAKAAAARGCPIFLDPAPAQPLPETFYPLCSYITPNETEAGVLIGRRVQDKEDAHQVAQALVQRGASSAIIKMGDKGACFLSGYDDGYISAFKVNAVDTVGAGDAFNAALAVATAEREGLREALRWACAAGALTVTKQGAQEAMPWRQEVEHFLQQHA